MKKAWIGLLNLLLLLHFCGAAAHAQATSRVTGLVQDTTGGTVVGASVILIN
jgi:hypothetical protein